MIISVDPTLREPPYQQIWMQVVAAVATGSLATGTRLPTIRQLAADLDLATGTIARAYRELEVAGVIETRGRKGSFVRESTATPPAVERGRQLDVAARACVEEARRLGAPAAEVAAALARALAAT
ncbi:MAG: GntR family transcriptional regulator [Aquihabitans sp.]